MRLLVLYGPPACGKLTVGKEVAQRTGFALFHNHLIMDALLAIFLFGSAPFVRLRERFWMETIEAAAESGKSVIFTFCPEPTVDPLFPQRLKALVEEAGGTVSFVRLEVSEEEQERRLTDPSRTGGKLRRVQVLRSWKADFDAALAGMPTPALSIDTTSVSASDAADRIVAALGMADATAP